LQSTLQYKVNEAKRGIGAIGRNLNQIARAVNQQQWPAGPDAAALSEVIRLLAVTRAQIKALINANLASWDSGHGTTAG
jgi:hypothetical protein